MSDNTANTLIASDSIYASTRSKDAYGRMHISRAKIAHSSIDMYAVSDIPNARQRLPHIAADATHIRVLRDSTSLQEAASRYQRIPLYLMHTRDIDEHKKTGTMPIDRMRLIGTVGSNTDFAHDEATKTDAVYADLCVWDADAISAIEGKAIEQLSASYDFELIPTHGVLDGKPFDAIMRVKDPGHVALVPRARGGETLRIGDSAMSKIDQLKAITLEQSDIASDADKAAALEYHTALGKLLDVKPVEIIKTVASDAAPGLTQAQLDLALAVQAEKLQAEATARHAAAVDTRVTLGDIALDSADEYYIRALDELKTDRDGVSGTANLAALYKLALRSKSTTTAVASDAAKVNTPATPSKVVGKGGIKFNMPNIERAY